MPDESTPAPTSRERPLSNVGTDVAKAKVSEAVDRRPTPSITLVNSFHSIQLSLDAAMRWGARDPVDHEELALALRCARESAEIAWRCLTEE
ncbi:hypothetical protein QFZ54_003108 [Sphingomonas faeni]|nr:hypothetical protein [Sphingomonas faeni]